MSAPGETKSSKSSTRLLSKKKLLKIVAEQPVADFLPGEWESRKPGSGYDFEGLKEFGPGDPISQIDWLTRARTGKLYVREFLAESRYNLILILDLSASMACGRKTALADTIAVSLAWSACKTNNLFGLLLWADELVFYLPPGSGLEHFNTLVTVLSRHQPRPRSAFALSGCLNYLKTLPFQSLTFLLSDLLDPLPEADLMASGHEIKVLQLLEEVEKELPGSLSGLINCADPETGLEYQLDLNQGARYNRRMTAFLQQLKERFNRAGIAATVITPADAFVDKINALEKLAPATVYGVESG